MHGKDAGPEETIKKIKHQLFLIKLYGKDQDIGITIKKTCTLQK